MHRWWTPFILKYNSVDSPALTDARNAVTDLKEFSFHFHDALPRVRRALLLLHAGDVAPGCSSPLDGILFRGLFAQTSTLRYYVEMVVRCRALFQ